MYLNIIEYIDEEKQEKIIEMINMAEKYQGIIAQIKNEGIKEGERKGERNLILQSLKHHTLNEVATFRG